MKGPQHTIATFRRPDKPGYFLWACSCDVAGLADKARKLYRTREDAHAGGMEHRAEAHPLSASAARRRVREAAATRTLSLSSASPGVAAKAKGSHVPMAIFRAPDNSATPDA